MAVYNIFFSPTKGGATLAAAVANTLATNLEMEQVQIPLTLPQDRGALTPTTLEKGDIALLTLPVYGGRIPLLVAESLAKLKGQNTPIVLLAVYGNRAVDDALLEMQDMMKAQGFVPVAAAQFPAEHSYTAALATARPDAKDVNTAADFGNQLAQRFAQNNWQSPLQLPGNFPYKERKQAAPLGPSTTDACIDCMLCAKECPTAAISFEDPRIADPQKCVKCCNCVKVCPTKAKHFGDALDPAITWLTENFTQRQEATFYF